MEAIGIGFPSGARRFPLGMVPREPFYSIRGRRIGSGIGFVLLLGVALVIAPEGVSEVQASARKREEKGREEVRAGKIMAT